MTYSFDATSGRTLALFGDRYRLLATREQTEGALAVMEVTVGPGNGAPPHIDHNEAIGWFVIEGELTFMVEGEEQVLGAGGWIYSPKSVLHTFANKTDRPARALLLAIPAGLDALFEETGREIGAHDSPQPPTEADIARFMTAAPAYGLEMRMD